MNLRRNPAANPAKAEKAPSKRRAQDGQNVQSKTDEKDRRNADRHAARSRVEIENSSQPHLPDADLSARDAFDRAVPRPVQVAASWSWRVIVIGAAIAGLGWALRYMSELTVPLAVAILLTAMLHPVTKLLLKTGLPHGAAVAISIVGGLVAVGGVITGITAVIPGGMNHWPIKASAASNS